VGKINIRSDDAPAVSAHHLHRDASAPFETAPYIPTVPSQTEGDLGIDACISSVRTY
jgi:hypothetical protein